MGRDSRDCGGCGGGIDAAFTGHSVNLSLRP
jgi:hypothetical protein